MLRSISHHPFFIRLSHWEYWPFAVVYGPILFYWLWLSIRARSFFFFTATNPGIENGGFVMESKFKIYESLPPGTYPKTIYIKAGELPEQKGFAFSFPLIAKPDIGGKGRGVMKVKNWEELEAYGRGSKLDWLIQEWVPFEHELGIFYYRYPNETGGHISGIVRKDFFKVKGDGQATIEGLLKKEKRYILQLKAVQKIMPGRMQEVLADGKEEVLIPYGNHARGAKFIDDTAMSDPALVKMMDELCSQIPGFYFGRLDIRFNSWEELRRGEKFSIIELNGSGSEPTHMYDPRHSLFFAWKEIIRHWKILWQISLINRQNGLSFMPIGEGLRLMRENSRYLKTISADD